MGAVVRDPRRPQVVRACRRRRPCIANALIEIDPRYPRSSADAQAQLQQAKAALEEQAPRASLVTRWRRS